MSLHSLSTSVQSQNYVHFNLIKNDLKQQHPAIWAYGIDRSNRVVIVQKSDSLWTKIAFIIKCIFGRIDGSAGAFQKLKFTVKSQIVSEKQNKVRELETSIALKTTELSELSSKLEKVKREQGQLRSDHFVHDYQPLIPSSALPSFNSPSAPSPSSTTIKDDKASANG